MVQIKYKALYTPDYEGQGIASRYSVLDEQGYVVCVCNKKHNAELIAKLLEKYS